MNFEYYHKVDGYPVVTFKMSNAAYLFKFIENSTTIFYFVHFIRDPYLGTYMSSTNFTWVGCRYTRKTVETVAPDGEKYWNWKRFKEDKVLPNFRQTD